jgi:hypothetical protein
MRNSGVVVKSVIHAQVLFSTNIELGTWIKRKRNQTKDKQNGHWKLGNMDASLLLYSDREPKTVGNLDYGDIVDPKNRHVSSDQGLLSDYLLIEQI